jgi:hypothetical protein
MSSFVWVLLDAQGSEMRTSDPFESKESAESWMGAEWANLASEGAEFVSLREDGAQLYKMSLSEA